MPIKDKQQQSFSSRSPTCAQTSRYARYRHARLTLTAMCGQDYETLNSAIRVALQTVIIRGVKVIMSGDKEREKGQCLQADSSACTDVNPKCDHHSETKQ